MLRCKELPAEEPNSNVTHQMSVLERQRAVFQRLYQQQQLTQNNVVDVQSGTNHPFQSMMVIQDNNGKIEQCFGENLQNSAAFGGEQFGFSCSDITTSTVENSFTTTVSHSSSKQPRKLEAQDSFSTRKESAVSTKKRKAAEFDVEEDCKTEAGESQSEITVKSDRESSKASGVKKPDYIHVRARRGQATDSHSLAERARREKISKKMKCLQDLVPGCNKVTGKAGMLDEIINYVQSLQKQVEFLSMKLATVNPRLDFNVDNLLAKELPAYLASFPTATMPLDVTNLAHFQLNPMQQVASSCGANIGTQMLPQKRETSSIHIPEAYPDSSCVPVSAWDTDLLSLYYGVNFQ